MSDAPKEVTPKVASPKAVVKAVAPVAKVDTLTPSLFKWFLAAATLAMFYYAVVEAYTIRLYAIKVRGGPQRVCTL